MEYEDLLVANKEMDVLATKLMAPRLEDEIYILLSNRSFFVEISAFRHVLRVTANPSLDPDDSLEYIVDTMRELKAGMSDDDKEQAYIQLLLQILIKHGVSMAILDLFHVFIATGTVKCPFVPGLAKATVNTRTGNLHLEFDHSLPASLIDECTAIARKHWREKYPIQKYHARDNQQKAFEVVIYRSSHTEEETASKFNLSTDNVRKICHRVEAQRKSRLAHHERIPVPLQYIQELLDRDT